MRQAGLRDRHIGRNCVVLAKARCRSMKPPRRILNQPVVLLVEDEFWVVEAQDADEAFELLRSRSDVAAVLTDVNMPGSMDGFEFARLVRQGWPVVGVIVISGQVNPGPGDLPSHATFLRKPFRAAALIKTPRDVMVAD